jgi:hypothetical protein
MVYLIFFCSFALWGTVFVVLNLAILNRKSWRPKHVPAKIIWL